MCAGHRASNDTRLRSLRYGSGRLPVPRTAPTLDDQQAPNPRAGALLLRDATRNSGGTERMGPAAALRGGRTQHPAARMAQRHPCPNELDRHVVVRIEQATDDEHGSPPSLGADRRRKTRRLNSRGLTTHMSQSLLTASDLTRMLGVPTSWVYEQSQRGLIPTVTRSIPALPARGDRRLAQRDREPRVDRHRAPCRLTSWKEIGPQLGPQMRAPTGARQAEAPVRSGCDLRPLQAFRLPVRPGLRE